ncbi:MAG: oligosaccharide flippase family protein [Azoarcus sp.]|jgi:O-antigen/teichoic acid export membrane protein|nr:oligosaccharide flippase family protein [Azoarcus sp.]
MMSIFWKNVALVLSGTALAQTLPILGSLIIARQYAPAEFGVFAAWQGFVLFLAIVLTGRFETALAIEPDCEPRRAAFIGTLVTAMMAAVSAAFILVLVVVTVPNIIVKVPTILIVLLIPTALVVAVSQTWQSWAAAEGRYRVLSAIRIVESSTITFFQIGFGFFDGSAVVLGSGFFFGEIVALTVAIRLMPPGSFYGMLDPNAIFRFWRSHYRFPLWSLPADTINTAAAQLPVLVVAGRFGTEISGLLAMAMRMLGAPLGLLGKSVLDVFKRQAATSFKERGECRIDYLRTLKVLTLGSLVFCTVMYFVGEEFFILILGEDWRDVGTIAIWLLPLFALRFIASPLSYIVYIVGMQHIDLIWQIALFAMTLACLTIPRSYDIALQSYSFGYSLLYIVMLILTYRFCLGQRR